MLSIAKIGAKIETPADLNSPNKLVNCKELLGSSEPIDTLGVLRSATKRKTQETTNRDWNTCRGGA